MEAETELLHVRVHLRDVLRHDLGHLVLVDVLLDHERLRLVHVLDSDLERDHLLLGHERLLSVDQSGELLQRVPQLDRAALEARAVRLEPFAQGLGRRVQKLTHLVERDVQLAQPADRLAVARLLERVPAVAGVLVHVRGTSRPIAS